MGSKISIGLVYEIGELKSKVEVLGSVINSLMNSNGVQGYKYSKDTFGEEWVQSDVNPNLSDEVLKSIISNYYSELTISTNEFFKGSHTVILRVENEDDYFGMLIDLEEESVKTAGYDVVETKVIEFLSREFNVSKYAYAFCENEGEIELSPVEVNTSDAELFSVLMKPDGGIVKIYKSSWKLDGISKR